jgi:hypothetical protein
VSRVTTLVGYYVLVAAFVGCQLAGLLAGRISTIGEAVAWVARRRAGRWLLLAGWMWVGWHLFARSPM